MATYYLKYRRSWTQKLKLFSSGTARTLITDNTCSHIWGPILVSLSTMLRHLALVMKTVNYWVIKPMSKAKHDQSKSMLCSPLPGNWGSWTPNYVLFLNFTTTILWNKNVIFTLFKPSFTQPISQTPFDRNNKWKIVICNMCAMMTEI